MTMHCSKCILPGNLPNVTFDQDGLCNYCRDFKKHYSDQQAVSSEEMKKHFEHLLAKIRGKGSYDCLVPLSGGKDSSYVLYEIVKTYGMRALAYNFDNGFRNPSAVKNIENIVNRLGVDLVVFKLSSHTMNRLFRTFLSTAGEFCTPCNMLMGLWGVHLAKQYGIKAIMTGNSDYMSPGLKGVSPAEYYDRHYYLNIIRDKIDYQQVKQYIVPPYTLSVFQRLLGTRPTVIDVLEYLRPSITHMHKILVEECGWEQPGGEIQHGDCIINAVKDYLMYKRWGCTEITAVYSVGVRTGEFTREEALKKAQEEEHSCEPAVLPLFLERIGMTKEEFEKASQKDFTSIPNIRSTAFYQWAKRAVKKIETIMGKR